MVKVRYNSRILCDKYFMAWLLKHPKKISLISRLMHIKSVSQDYKGEHNIILDFDFKDIKTLTKEHWIRACVKEVSSPDFLDDGLDEFTKRIIYAIWLANRSPFNTYIFTSPENKNIYEENEHLQGMTSVKIKTEDNAIEIINNFYRDFTFQREMTR